MANFSSRASGYLSAIENGEKDPSLTALKGIAEELLSSITKLTATVTASPLGDRSCWKRHRPSREPLFEVLLLSQRARNKSQKHYASNSMLLPITY